MDLIDRQDAIDAIMGKTNDSIVEAQAIDILCDLPSAQQWTPISERLPEEQQIVVTYQKWGEYKLNLIIDGTEWYWDGVVAWMPLPEPYREEAENADANGG